MTVDDDLTEAPTTAPAPESARRQWSVPAPSAIWDVVRRVAGAPWLIIVAWVITRAMMLHDWSAKYQFIKGDPNYYYSTLRYVTSIDQRLPEYPVPVVAFLELFRWPAADVASTFVTVFAVGMAALDAGFTVVLWSFRGRLAAWYWMVFGFLMGPLLWFRFDVLPAVTGGVALLLVTRRPATSGALLGLGAAIKLWPALLLLPLLHRGRAGRRRIQGLLVTGGLLALVSWAAVGWTRLVSPLTWQNDRGLQVESVPASLAMAGKSFGDTLQWTIAMSKYNAYEITGPGVSTALVASSVLMALVLGLAVVFAVLGWQALRDLSAFDLTLAGAGLIAFLIVANKTFSPQYMFWLGAPLAVLLLHAIRPPRGTGAREIRSQRIIAGWLAGAGLIAARLTQVEYPDHYGDLIFVSPADPVITSALILRNLLLVVIAVGATTHAMRRFWRAGSSRSTPSRGLS